MPRIIADGLGKRSTRTFRSSEIKTVTFSGTSDVTLSVDDVNANALLLEGAITADVNLIVPSEKRKYSIINRTTGGFTVTVKTASGEGVVFDPEVIDEVYSDGTDVTSIDVEQANSSAIAFSIALG